MLISSQSDTLSLLSSSGFENVLASTLTTQNLPRGSRTSQNPSNSGASGSTHNSAIATWTEYATNPSIIQDFQASSGQGAANLAAQLPDHARVLDLGAGNAIASLEIADAGRELGKIFEIDAVDMIPPEPFLDQKRRYSKQAQEMVTYHQSSLKDFDFKPGFGTYDYVIAARVLPYLESSDQLSVIHNIVGSLKSSQSGADFQLKEGGQRNVLGQMQYPLHDNEMRYIKELLERKKVEVEIIHSPDKNKFQTIHIRKGLSEETELQKQQQETEEAEGKKEGWLEWIGKQISL